MKQVDNAHGSICLLVCLFVSAFTAEGEVRVKCLVHSIASISGLSLPSAAKAITLKFGANNDYYLSEKVMCVSVIRRLIPDNLADAFSF